MKKKPIIIIAAVAALVIILVFSMKQDNTKAIAVKTEKVTLKTLESEVFAAGYVQPVVKVNISANVSGEIKELYVKEGQLVKQGDLLAQLDKVIYDAAVKQAKSYYNSNLAAKRVAENDYKRAKALYKENNYSESQFDIARLGYEQAESSLAQSQAQLEQAQDNLNKTTLQAPIDGMVIGLRKEKGEIVMGSTFQADIIMTIGDLSEMEVEVDVNENDIVRVDINDHVDIEIDAIPDKVFEGNVTEISQLASTTGSGTQNAVTNFKVMVKMFTIPQGIRSGMNATVEILTDRKENVVAVPIQAVTVRSEDKVNKGFDFSGEKPEMLEVVFVVEDDTVRAAHVELGISSEDDFEILSGVDTSDVIVIGSHQVLTHELQSGAAVGDETDKKKKK